MRTKIVLLVVLIMSSVQAFGQWSYHYTYPVRRVYYPRNVIVRNYCPPTQVVIHNEESPRVVHVENKRNEIVVVHNKVEREVINDYNTSNIEYINQQGSDDIVKYEPNSVSTETSQFTPSDMWCVSINFKINSYEMEDSRDDYSNANSANLFNIVKTLREHPNLTISLYAYADKYTGTTKINKIIAKKRLDVVYNTLVNIYNIESHRISAYVISSKEQFYGINDWNRCVIIKAN